jgi:hypothetical protein
MTIRFQSRVPQQRAVYTTLTEDQFDSEFQPQPNALNPNASWGGCLYETYDEELEYVLRADPHHVWTWVEGDEGGCLVSGRHYINRLGYIITARPWSDDADYLVSIDEVDG